MFIFSDMMCFYYCWLYFFGANKFILKNASQKALCSYYLFIIASKSKGDLVKSMCLSIAFFPVIRCTRQDGASPLNGLMELQMHFDLELFNERIF